jgi:methionyl-tRNA formyltransferase
MMESLDLVKAGKAPKVPQNHAKATYESWFKKDLAEIDWSKPLTQVYNLIRASNPAPGAWSVINGQKVEIFDSAKVAGAGKPGEIIAVGEQGMTIAAEGGAILAKRVRGGDGKKIPAAEFAKSAGLKMGDTFDPPTPKPAA